MEKSNASSSEIEKLKEKLDIKEAEIKYLKETLKNRTHVSKDTRIAIQHEVLEKVDEKSKSRIKIVFSILTIIILALTFFGYQNFQRLVQSSINIQDLEKKIIKNSSKELENIMTNSDQVTNIKNEITSLSNMLEKFKSKEIPKIKSSTSRILNLENETRQMADSIKKSQEQAHKLVASIQRIILETETIKDVLPEEARQRITEISQYKFLGLFGLSPESFSAVLKKETGFVFSKESMDRLDNSIGVIQERYTLLRDGSIGPATGLLITTIAMDIDPQKVKKELQDSLLSKRPDLIRVLGATNRFDREALFDIFSNKNHTLNKAFNDVLEAAKIDYQGVKQILSNYELEPYRLLPKIGYEDLTEWVKTPGNYR